MPYAEHELFTLHHGNSLDVLPTLPDNSIDAIVTDPPYGLAAFGSDAVVEAVTRWTNGERDFIPEGKGFMGKAWDAFVPPPAIWDECLRVLKPGGHLLAFFGSRTQDLGALSIRLAGFEIRDSVAWIYGSGFPKSMDISKAIDKRKHNRGDVLAVTAWIRSARDAAGLTNGDIDRAMGFAGMAGHWTSQQSQPAVPTLEQVPKLLDVLGVALDDVPDAVRELLWTLNGEKGKPGPAWFAREVTGVHAAPAAAQQWNANYGLRSNLQQNERRDVAATPEAAAWQGWGTALKPAFEPVVMARKPFRGTTVENVLAFGTGALNIDAGRVGTMVQEGDVPAGRWPSNVMLDEFTADQVDNQGGASRFFYVAKASKRDRNEGLGALPDTETHRYGAGIGEGNHPEAPTVDKNFHPTVKPTALLRQLVRLITPPGGTVLDPFTGSGSTGKAAILDGFKFVGVEMTDEYLPIIEGRLLHAVEIAQTTRDLEPLF